MSANSALTIRPLEWRDLTAALAIQDTAYPAFLREGADAFASRIELTPSYCLAATCGDDLVAYLLAHGWARQAPPPIGAILSAVPVAEVLYIHDLAVSPAGRGSGAGRRLVMRAFERAARDGLTVAELIAVEGAAGYWRTLGFAEGERSADLSAKVSAYGPGARWMTREIGPAENEPAGGQRCEP